MAITRLANGSWLLRAPTDQKERREWLEFWGLKEPVQQKAWALGELAILDVGVRLWMLSGRRDPQEQAALQRRVHSRPVADPGESKHQTGEAFDVGTDYDLRDEVWQDLGAAGKCLGLTWGGDFPRPDPNHFEV